MSVESQSILQWVSTRLAHGGNLCTCRITNWVSEATSLGKITSTVSDVFCITQTSLGLQKWWQSRCNKQAPKLCKGAKFFLCPLPKIKCRHCTFLQKKKKNTNMSNAYVLNTLYQQFWSSDYMDMSWIVSLGEGECGSETAWPLFETTQRQELISCFNQQN